MKRIRIMAVCVLVCVLLAGCRVKPDPSGQEPGTEAAGRETINGTDIAFEDVVDFYYTYDWIGYNAFYQRYRFYVEDGKYLFFHETRKTEDDYGWNTEEDITASGTRELSDEEWKTFLEFLNKGTIQTPEESADAGDGASGPWQYVYYRKGKDTERMEFLFDSLGSRTDFEEFCAALAGEEG